MMCVQVLLADCKSCFGSDRSGIFVMLMEIDIVQAGAAVQTLSSMIKPFKMQYAKRFLAH